MNLNKLVQDKIKQLGPTKAAAYFGVSVPTIYAWKNGKKIPVSAVQKVMDEIPPGETPLPEFTGPVEDLLKRLETVEKWIAKQGGPKPPIKTGIPISTKSKAEVLPGQGDRKPKGEGWNQQPKEKKIGGGWNTPVAPTTERNPSGNWNKPLPE